MAICRRFNMSGAFDALDQVLSQPGLPVARIFFFLRLFFLLSTGGSLSRILSPTFW